MTLQADLQNAVTAIQTAYAKLSAVVNGPASGEGSTVTVESGTLKTLAKAVSDLEAAYASANVIVALQAIQAATEAARDAALAAFDNFDDKYLGSKTADPTLDNDGNALVNGALYFYIDEIVPANSHMRVYLGSAWQAAYISAVGVLMVANALSELASVAATVRTNLGLGDAATKNTGTAAGTVAAGDHTHSLTSASISDFTEASQDVVGAMVAAAGGSYDDGGGTIAFPASASVPYGNIQTFTSSGTFTVPAGITKAFVEIWGAGGGAANTGDTGGGGGYAAKLITGLTPGANVTVTVGTSAANTVGGTSSFGAYCSATGGQTGYTASGTLYGGTGTGGDINMSGQGGHRVPTGTGGAGGCAPRGGGGGGGPGANATGCVGAVPGGGGGHAGDTAYGAGGAGLVVVYW